MLLVVVSLWGMQVSMEYVIFARLSIIFSAYSGCLIVGMYMGQTPLATFVSADARAFFGLNTFASFQVFACI
jgi:hypothetical protein